MVIEQRVSLQPAFILHSRPYGDTSYILDGFSREMGRVSLMARGYRKKTGRLPQLFTELLVSWSGRGEIKTLTAVESVGPGAQLLGQQLYAALYINELLVRLLPKFDAHPRLFDDYRSLIPALVGQTDLEPSLRVFEFHLLAELGYAINLSLDARDATPINTKLVYRYLPDEGFVAQASREEDRELFLGEDLLAIAAGDYSESSARRAAKRLARMALTPLLGARPLKSRELFRQLQH